jgi:hypothetical protein
MSEEPRTQTGGARRGGGGGKKTAAGFPGDGPRDEDELESLSEEWADDLVNADQLLADAERRLREIEERRRKREEEGEA